MRMSRRARRCTTTPPPLAHVVGFYLFKTGNHRARPERNRTASTLCFGWGDGAHLARSDLLARGRWRAWRAQEVVRVALSSHRVQVSVVFPLLVQVLPGPVPFYEYVWQSQVRSRLRARRGHGFVPLTACGTSCDSSSSDEGWDTGGAPGKQGSTQAAMSAHPPRKADQDRLEGRLWSRTPSLDQLVAAEAQILLRSSFLLLP